MRTAEDADFREFARARALVLRRTAYLLCGDWHLAEDLVQNALVKLYRVWPKIIRRGPVDHYARQVLLRCWLDESRRPWRRRERRDGVVPDVPSPESVTGISGPLLRALAEVPPKQRAAVVLRYCADLPAAEVAEVLRCSEGTVRSQAARGLETLRGVLEHSAERSA
ncbi:SigE family RNA polymerase sigma factor [Amycolatopsis sp. A133]|jgi:RNA polymerase sigma-70 factor (sigma-E family)|uniref:SigE family RNA polymerase sigma factor n=1 Tax=Amycolatopsis sp. A133 TaxID=3064472 RepID=UPI0027F80D6B|nr:SigE family RNA polymerase sigma factor [Amycolatopsis sp. A133]MDQ7810649.1 SigE family RNA polymerase sigma factor [Amycolatopsis sp. A133]